MAAEAHPGLRRVERGYLGFQLFFALLFWVPVHYEFQRRIGLGDERIFAIQGIYYLAFCLLEIPTGYFADAIGHLRSMKTGAILLVACNLLPVVSPTDGGVLTHFLLLALARSFVSGASSAYLYGRLAAHGMPERFEHVEGRARAWGLVAKIASWGVVGALLAWDLRAPYLATAVASAIAVVFAWTLPASREPRAAERSGLPLGDALASLRTQPLLPVVMVQGIALFVLGRVVQTNLFQPILGARSLPVESYGLVMAAMAAVEALGSARPDVLGRWLRPLDAVFATSLVTAASLPAMVIGGVPGTLVGLGVFSLATGLAYPIQRRLVVETIPDARYRATLLSVESIADRGVNALAVAWLGGFVARGELGAVLHVACILTVGVVLATQLAARYLERGAG
jgi:MFS family permease